MEAIAGWCFCSLGVVKAKEFALLSLNIFQVFLCPDGECDWVLPVCQARVAVPLLPRKGAGGCFDLGRYCQPAAGHGVFDFPGLQQRPKS